MSANQLLQWAIENSDPETQRAAAEKAEPKKIDPEIIDAILGKSDASQIRDAVNVIADPEQTVEDKEIAFDNLEMLLENLENAIDIEKMNLWPTIISFLSLPQDSLRVHATWVCGTAMQNNTRAQDAFAKSGGLKVIMDMLKNPNEVDEVRSKAIYAVSGAIKHYPPGLVTFEREGGYDALLALIESSDSLPILRKAVFLFNTLLLQDAKTFGFIIKDKGLVHQMVRLLNTHAEDDEDLVHKVLTTILGMFRDAPRSLSEDERRELKDILPKLKAKYNNMTLTNEECNELEEHARLAL